MAWSDLFALVKDAVFGAEDVLSNRRKQPRILLHLPVRCRLDGPDFPGELVDLGLRGMRLSLPQRVHRQQMLVVSALPGDGIAGKPELRCEVVWCRQNGEGKFQAGVIYKDTSENLATSWVHYLLLQRNCPIGERKDRRVEAALPVEVGDAEGQALMVGQILDLSLGGAKVRLPSRLLPLEKFVLKIGANNPKLKPITIEAQMVGQAQSVLPSDNLLAGQSDNDMLCSFKFASGDAQGRALKKLLLSLLNDLRKEKRPKSASVNGVRLPGPPPQMPRPQGPLASAVNSGFLESPKRSEKKKTQTSKFLKSQPPDFLRAAPSAQEDAFWQKPESQPKWRTAQADAAALEESSYLNHGKNTPAPPRTMRP